MIDMWGFMNCSEAEQSGSVINMLKYYVYVQDSSYIQQLSIPMAGLTLKTRVFAAVKANNLDRRYSVNI